MTNLKTKLATATIAAAVIATTVASTSFAATEVVVRRNGADSTQNVTVSKKTKTKVKQKNSTAVLNLTGVFQNTGGNSANKNVGGGVNVDSGNATATVTNTTSTGGNTASLPCGCPEDDNETSVRVSRNGADSTQNVSVSSKTTTKVSQVNETLVVNGTLVKQNTGGNEANKNVADGDIDVNSGDADATVENTTETGGNTLNPVE